MHKRLNFNLKVGKVTLLAAAFAFTGACSGEAQQSSAVENEAEISAVATDENGNAIVGVFTAEPNEYEFGQVTEGTLVEHVFTFKNTGEAPLILTQVTASCGCTTPEYSKHPVAPGEEGQIKVVFDSNGQVGKQHKVISVLNNGATQVALLHLRGEVVSN
jgi:hypothetical protein